jgi:hypothetical protein
MRRPICTILGWMQGRISVLAVGLALALGGGVAGAALISSGIGEEPSVPTAELAAERSAAESQKVAYAKLQHALKTAQKARRIARRARNKANESLATTTALLDDVDKALADSADALLAAEEAEGDASTALARIDSTQVVSDTAPGTATAPSANTDYHPAPDGPRVTVTVPPSGLIEVWATVTVESDEGAVALFRDGNVVPIPGQDGICDLDNALLMAQVGGGPLTISTPPGVPGFGGICGTVGDAPAPVLFNQPPGEHTYELRYADCGCSPGDDAIFSNRTLRVGPRL